MSSNIINYQNFETIKGAREGDDLEVTIQLYDRHCRLI